MEEKENNDLFETKIDTESEHSPMLTIEEPKHWLILICCFSLLFLLLLWSIFGRITTEVIGRSVSISSGGVFLIESKAEGNVLELFVHEGINIKKNTPLARVNNPKLWSIATNIESMNFKKNKLESELILLRRSLITNEELFRQGLIAKMIIDNSKSDIMQKLIQIEETQASVDNLFTELELNSFAPKEVFNKKKRLWMMHGHFVQLNSVIKELSTIFSPSDGKVLEVLVNRGETINKKEQIFWMEYPLLLNEPEVFFATLRADTLGRLKKGQKVFIEPSSADSKEYGAIIGAVEGIYPYPVSKEELMQNIGNLQIVDYLLEESKAMTQIKITPEINTDTVSGFKWTSDKGPPFEIASGTLCKIRIIIDEQPPISYLIPLWKIKPL